MVTGWKYFREDNRHHGEKFDPQKGIGDIEIWIPVDPK